MFRRLMAFVLWAGVGVAAQAAGTPPPSAEDFAARPQISSVSVSPNGKRIVALVSPAGGPPLIAIWRIEALNAPPTLLPQLEDMVFVSVRFLKDDHVLATAAAQFPNGSLYHRNAEYVTDLSGDYFQLSNPIHSVSPDPDTIVLGNGATGLYKLNLKKLGLNTFYERIYSASDTYFDPILNQKGVRVSARQKLNFDSNGPYFSVELRDASGGWAEHFRNYALKRSDIDILHFESSDDVAVIRAAVASDHGEIYSYSIRQKKFLEKLFSNVLFDVKDDIVLTSPGHFGEIIGFRFSGPTDNEIRWSKPEIAALMTDFKTKLGEVDTRIEWADPGAGIKATVRVPENYAVQPVSFSDDLQTWVLEKNSPQTPPEYYVAVAGAAPVLLGKSRPQIQTAALGQTQLLQIKTRDGLHIPVYLTKPPASIWGPGPYPAIVLPHGGPWARDSWRWDPTGWVQYFAARGYVVIQPQYRGSAGWGGTLWAAGDGQWGLKMSDDNDDAAAWLVSQGLARAGHIVLHGYSYGGFAAYVAAERAPSGLYRCVIAGGAGGDLKLWRGYSSETAYAREFQGVTMTGFSPVEHIDQVHLPILIYHSENDTTVPLKEALDMRDRLIAAGKSVKFLQLDQQAHTNTTWAPQNTALLLRSLDVFLTHDCGPGGVNGPDAVATR